MLELLIPSFTSGELIIFAILVIVGIVIVLVLSAVIHFMLPIIAAIVVWFLTGSLIYAGIAFLAIAILQLLVSR